MPDGIYGWKRSAKQQYNIENPESDHDREEEPFNDRIIELIDRSLEYGPDLLNAIQHVDFDDAAEIIGHQSDPLTEGNKEIDWTIQDSQKIVAYESKRGSSIKIGQLGQEYDQLQEYADHRNIHLVLVTEHISKPDKLAQCEYPVEWMSWYEMAQRLNNYETEDSSAHSEIHKIFQKVFELENMDSKFKGFEDAHPRQLDYFMREIYFTAPRTAEFESVDFINRRPDDFEDSLDRSHRPLGKKYYELELYRPEWNRIDNGFPRSYPCVIIDRGNLESPVKVYAGVSVNPGYNDEIAQGVKEHKQRIIQLTQKEELGLIFSENTLTHAEKGMEPTVYAPEEITDWDISNWNDKFDLIFDEDQRDHRRIIFNRRIDTIPRKMVSETINTVEEVSGVFLKEIPEFFKQSERE